VLFETFGGKAAGDNPAPLCEELARRDLGFDLVFSVAELSIPVPSEARAVLRWSREWHELIGRAQYIVCNANLPYFFAKREGQIFLETWHGSPLKRIAHDRPNLDFDNWHHRRQLTASVAGWDYLVSQSGFCTQSLRSAFRYDGAVLETGYPRNDVLRSPGAVDLRRRTRQSLGLSDEDKVILYAPTWRDNMRVGHVFNKVLYLDAHMVADKVDNAVVLVRGHYNTIRAANSDGMNERVMDVTRHPDISHLYLAADALVTDYSSVFFDFALTDKPMAFIAPDLDHYRDETRGFYLDYHETVPGPVCDDTEEVIDVLNGPDRYAHVREQFRAQFTPYDDGGASRRVIDAVFGPS
jgi:CDP-glycerol glycerophosphotransferase (TagB/SpsB family)